MLFDEVAGPVGAPDAAGVFCCGLRVVSVDGSTTDVPDSKENDEHFGRPSNATRAGAFPQVRWLADQAPAQGLMPDCRPSGPSVRQIAVEVAPSHGTSRSACSPTDP